MLQKLQKLPNEFQMEDLFEYEAIRRSGITNMFDRWAVKMLADTHKLNRLAKIAEDARLYSKLLQTYGTVDLPENRYQDWFEGRGLLLSSGK